MTMAEAGSGITAQELLETLQAYKRTSLLKAAIELKLFDALAGGPRSAEQLATELGTPQRATRILLGALAATGLLDSDGVKFVLPAGAERLLVSTSDQYRGGAVRLLAGDLEWDTMRDLASIVRHDGTLLADGADVPAFPYWTDFAQETTFVARAAAQTFIAAVKPWAGARTDLRILDVGCGHALPSLLLAQTLPGAEVCLLDSPPVLAHARANADRLGVAGRVHYLAGDAFTTPAGDLARHGPYDIVLLANLLPLFSAARGVELLRRLAPLLRPEGRLAVVGFTVGDRQPAEEHGAHMLSLLMLAWTAGGETHAVHTYREMLTAAGFGPPEVHPVGALPLHVLISAHHRKGDDQ
ncbi:methyltransferase family protein [Actinoplanes sp. NPDC004185]